MNDRDEILGRITEALEAEKWVDAVWEGGAVSNGRLDTWSDIDLMVVAPKEKRVEAFTLIEKTLSAYMPIEQVYIPPVQAEAGYGQKFYRLRNVSKFLLIDLAVFDPDAPDKFTGRKIHNEPALFFDRTGVTSDTPLDIDAHLAKIEKTTRDMMARIEMFHSLVEKEFYRNNILEASMGYHTMIFPALVTMVRSVFNPEHFDFRMRYLHQELPAEITGRLSELAFAADISALRKNFDEALSWMRELYAKFDRATCREQLTAKPGL